MYLRLHILLKVFASVDATVVFFLTGIRTSFMDASGGQLPGIDGIEEFFKGGFASVFVRPEIAKLQILGIGSKEI